ncbi:MAG: TIM barrel protein, partial [Candidatus Thermoplasmatota archaeon]|nr:TIM barrel protein [Candidatus Thermoplasmatota archaeon]
MEDTHHLGLTALEAQIVRVNYVEREVREKEIGLLPTEVPGEILIMVKGRENGELFQKSLMEPLEETDVVYSLVSTIAKDYADLQDVGRLARDLDVELSVHAPYYMDFVNTNDEDTLQRSYTALRCTSEIARALGAKVVTCHMGIYRGEIEDAVDNVVANLKPFVQWMKDEKMENKLGVETSGKQDVFGSLDEVVDAVRQLKNTIPVLNFSHIHSRESGSLMSRESYEPIFERIMKIQKDNFHSHFSGVEHGGGNEKRYTPIKKGDLKFEHLVDYLLEQDFSMTLISSSPLMEHDAMYMRVIYERQAIKREAKRLRMEEKAREEFAALASKKIKEVLKEDDEPEEAPVPSEKKVEKAKPKPPA